MGREVMGARVGHLSYTRGRFAHSSRYCVQPVGEEDCWPASRVSLLLLLHFPARSCLTLSDPIKPKEEGKEISKESPYTLVYYIRATLSRPRYLFVSHDTNAASSFSTPLPCAQRRISLGLNLRKQKKIQLDTMYGSTSTISCWPCNQTDRNHQSINFQTRLKRAIQHPNIHTYIDIDRVSSGNLFSLSPLKYTEYPFVFLQFDWNSSNSVESFM